MVFDILWLTKNVVVAMAFGLTSLATHQFSLALVLCMYWGIDRDRKPRRRHDRGRCRRSDTSMYFLPLRPLLRTKQWYKLSEG